MTCSIVNVLALLASIAGNGGNSAALNDLILRLTGFPSTDGVVRIAVFDSEESWPDNTGNSIWKTVAEVSGDTLSVAVEGLEPGSYAVSVFHDRDNDSVLDRNFLGIPTESYGFSNNVRGRTGPPDFSDAVVLFEGAPLLLEIRLE